MNLEIVTISLVVNLVILIKYNYSCIKQQVLLLLTFIIGLTFVGQLDTLLPLYFLSSVILIIRRLRNLSKITLCISIYFAIYLFYGVLVQDTVAAIIAFIAKYWQFIVFFLVYNITIKSKENISINLIYLSLLMETLLGIYLLFTGQMIDPNGLVRLVSNSQPITGNLAIAILPISAYLFFSDDTSYAIKRKILMVNLMFLVWIVLSGTRGYLLIYLLTMPVFVLDYLKFKTNNFKSLIKGIMLFIFSFAMITLALLVLVPDIVDKVDSILRLSASVGIRTYENALSVQFFQNTSIFVQIFGIGLGGNAGDYPEYLIALNKQLVLGMWHSSKYMYDSGVLFHNFYANILITLGIFGIIAITIISIYIFIIVKQSCYNNNSLRYVLSLYLIGFLMMNYYRWSADCGIGEMIILALVLKKINQDKGKKEEEYF